jgi:hypothetical protein
MGAVGWKTETGPAPWLADFNLVECPLPGYKARTQANARDSDSTVWFGRIGTPGHVATFTAATTLAKPYMLVGSGISRPSHVVEWLQSHPEIRVLNVAGNRESLEPGIADRVGSFLTRLFKLLDRDGRL